MLRLDPFSKQFRQEVYRAYRELRDGLPYDENTSEANKFDLEAFKKDNYPFNQRDNRYIGEHLAAISLILRDFPKPSGSRVVELGSGSGNLAHTFARAGYDVTAYDIESHYLQVIDHWSAVYGVGDRVKTVEGSFSGYDLSGPFDAAVFFGSFHHSVEHAELLKAVRRSLTPDGAIVFAGEPVEAEFDTPWRLRTDSLAAYCIRRLGWMEFGFREDYFVELVCRAGFYVEKRIYPDCKSANSYVARPYTGPVPLNGMYLLDGWHPPETTEFRWTSGPAALTLPEHARTVTIRLQNHNPLGLTVGLFAQGDAGRRLIAERSFGPAECTDLRLSLEPGEVKLVIDCPAWRPMDIGSPDPRTLGIAAYSVSVE